MKTQNFCKYTIFLHNFILILCTYSSYARVKFMSVVVFATSEKVSSGKPFFEVLNEILVWESQNRRVGEIILKRNYSICSIEATVQIWTYTFSCWKRNFYFDKCALFFLFFLGGVGGAVSYSYDPIRKHNILYWWFYLFPGSVWTWRSEIH